MTVADVLYDLVSGTMGAVLGALVTMSFNFNKNKRLRAEIVLRKKDLDAVRLENNKLLGIIKDKENQILELEKKIIKKTKK